MKITVIGSTGGVGRAVTEQAVAAGHDVTAVARDPGRVMSGVRAVRVNLEEDAAVSLQSAVAGADAVLSGLGAPTRADAGIASRGTRALIAAMQAGGTRRIVVVSAAPVSLVPTTQRPDVPKYDPDSGFATKYLLYPAISRVLRPIYLDLAEMEDALSTSGLDWTAVRPPRLTNRPLSGQYRTALDRNVRGGTAIGRADVAHLMLALAGRPETGGHTVGCGY